MASVMPQGLGKASLRTVVDGFPTRNGVACSNEPAE